MMQDERSPFADRAAVASYAVDAPRKVPGMADLHRMVTLLLTEQSPDAAHILVVGAGGGLEVKAMAEARPDWRFGGVDPSPAMLGLSPPPVLPFEDRVPTVPGTGGP